MNDERFLRTKAAKYGYCSRFVILQAVGFSNGIDYLLLIESERVAIEFVC